MLHASLKIYSTLISSLDKIMKNLLFSMLIVVTPFASANTSATTYESHAVIKQQIQDYISSNIHTLGDDNTVQVNNIDYRLKLKKCPSKLVIKTSHDELKAGRNTLNVSCVSNTPWRIFLTSYIRVFKQAYVANKTLIKGAIVKRTDVVLKKIDITSVHKRYLGNKGQIIDRAVKRTITSGSLFTINNLTHQTLIKRGDRVTIQASKNGFEISMDGIALANGSEGQRINVKNIRTKRVIQGIVDNKSIVRVRI